jgi:signal peptidase II
MSRRFRLYCALVALTIILDQLTKWWARSSLPHDGSRVSVIDGYWDWVLAYNTGSAFSLFAGARFGQIFLTAIGIAAVVAMTWMVKRATDDQRLFVASLALMAGGAVGNLIDRLAFGKVTDFVLWRVHEHTWPVFNIADVALSVAVATFLLTSLFRPKPA